MRPFEIPLEAQLQCDAVRRALDELYEEQEWDALFAHAHLLNELWHNERAKTRWLALEAAENLSLAVQIHNDQQSPTSYTE
jgi:hypothetical protein